MSLNDLEVRGLKEIVKEYIEEETDFKNRLDELEEDIRELQGNPTDTEDEEEDDFPGEEEEPESDLPEEEPLEDNPEREKYEENLEKVKQKPSGTRLSKEDMKKLQNPPAKKLKSEPLDEERWDEE